MKFSFLFKADWFACYPDNAGVFKILNGNTTIATNNWYWVVQELNSPWKTWISLRVSSPGRSEGGAGKGRRACNYRYFHRAQRSYLWIIVKFYGITVDTPHRLWSTYKSGNICVYVQVFILYWIACYVNIWNSPLQCRHGQKIFYQCHILHVAVKLNTLTLE